MNLGITPKNYHNLLANMTGTPVMKSAPEYGPDSEVLEIIKKHPNKNKKFYMQKLDRRCHKVFGRLERDGFITIKKLRDRTCLINAI